MPGFTPYYGLAFFNFGDNQADIANVQYEMNRFVVIDKQLYGLYSVFGSGVISGWEVTTPDFQNPASISVVVQAGIGIVNLLAAETLFSAVVTDLPPNQTSYVFAQATGLTNSTRTVTFFSSVSSAAPNSILLASVVTGDTGIVSIDNSVRQQIGFKALIDEEIKLHRHRGSPSKIDLVLETKNQLPGYKVGDVDAAAVTSGVLPQQVMPLIAHERLTNVGEFTHPQLDALVRKLSGDVDQLTGVISLINQLRGIIYLKHVEAEPDAQWYNMLAFVPGISPDSFIDFDASDCNINLPTNCLSGRPVEGGQPVSILWDSQAAFQAAYSSANVTIGVSGVKVARADILEQLVEGFEGATSGDLLSSFVSALEAVNSNTNVTADSTVKTEEGASGRFEMQQGARLSLTKTFDTPQDWSQYDRLLVDVRCTMLTHEAVYFYFVLADGTKSSTFPVLALNEVTTNPDPTMEDFETRIFAVGAYDRSQVAKIVFYADNVTDDLVFYLDDIRLKSSQQYKPSGSLRLRYAATDPVVFNSLVASSVLPSGTAVKCRLRAADNLVDLNTSLFTAFISGADTFTLRGRYAEVEVDLFASADFNLTPTLTSVELSFTASAELNGVSVDSLGEWSNGTPSNVLFTGTDHVQATVKPPITVGDMAFLNQNTVTELDGAGTPVFAVNGDSVPVSEVQAWQAIQGSTSYGFGTPLSCVRTADRRFILADTNNHRILVFASDGTLLRAYCGMNQDADVNHIGNPILITATYNVDTGVLWLGFSRTATVDKLNYGKIAVEFAGQRVTLADEGSVASTDTSTTTRVLAVTLTPEHQAMLDGITSPVMLVLDGAISADYNTLYQGEGYKVKVYYANVSYHPFIWTPVYAVEAIDGSGRLWICNATRFKQTLDASGIAQVPPTPTTRNLQLFDPSVDTGVFSNSVYFTTEFGGSVVETSAGNVVAGGVDTDYNGMIWRNASGATPTILYRSPNNAQPSMVTLDAGGNLWASESSGTARAGRVIKLDEFGNVTSQVTGPYTKINSLQVLKNADLLIGT